MVFDLGVVRFVVAAVVAIRFVQWLRRVHVLGVWLAARGLDLEIGVQFVIWLLRAVAEMVNRLPNVLLVIVVTVTMTIETD